MSEQNQSVPSTAGIRFPQRPFRKRDLTVKFEGMLDDNVRQQLLHEGINPLLVPSVVKQAEVSYLNKIYKGFGIKNPFGGMEFYCKDLPMQGPVLGPVTIDSPCVSRYPAPYTIRGRYCALFVDWLDYLSYLTLLDRDRVEKSICNSDRVGEWTNDCDCIVMNDTRNFVSMMLDADDYEHVYCFFPHSFIGGIMERTFQSRSETHVTMMSHLYDGYLNLHEYVKQINKEGGDER